jgi:NADH:ubiquinone oxidoreductase subunit 3 (subunit A)
MAEILLSPPIAFLVYLVLVGLLAGIGRVMAGPGHASEMKSSLYASGELASTRPAVPGYRPFFVIALFFAVLHLSVLVLGSSGLTPIAAVYLVGVVLTLLALILG